MGVLITVLRGHNAMTIADYFAIGVMCVLALWGAARLLRRA
jgi:hypothetical protein